MAKARKLEQVEQEPDASPSGILERALRVLELLAANARGLQLYQIAEQLAIPRSATHRILTALFAHGYVRQERQLGAYQLTAKIASLGFSFLAGAGISDFAQPILERIAQSAKELVRLAMIDGRELIFVAKAQGSPHGLRYDPDMGQVVQLSCSASGMAWLSCLSEAEAIALIEKQGYGLRKDFGPRAPETRAAVLKQLRESRKRGFGLGIQTYSPWMNAIAAPIHSRQTNEVVGVVVIAGPHIRLTEEKILEFAPILKEGAQELALAMMVSPGLPAGRPSARPNFFNE